jgi:hypothetical protein
MNLKKSKNELILQICRIDKMYYAWYIYEDIKKCNYNYNFLEKKRFLHMSYFR